MLELQWALEEPVAARISAARTLDGAFDALVDGLADTLERFGHPDVFAEMVRIYTRHTSARALDDQPRYVMRAVAARFVEAHANGRLRVGLDAAGATHLFLTSVFGYLSLPVDPDDARRDLRMLTSLYFTESARKTPSMRKS